MMTEHVFKNQALWAKMKNHFPGFSWQVKESRDGRPLVTFTRWPTRGASISPPRKGNLVSMEDITEYLEALKKGLPPAHEFDSWEIRTQVEELLKRRKMAGIRPPRSTKLGTRA